MKNILLNNYKDFISFIGLITYRFKYVIAILITLFVILYPPIDHYAFAPKAAASASAAPENVFVKTTEENYYLIAINDLRKQYSLEPLELDKRLSISAASKVKDMALSNYFEHYSPNGGPSFSDFIWRESPKAEVVAENLARCFATRQAAFEGLKASPSHLRVMVGDFEYFGIAEYYDKQSDCTLTVMHFSKY